MAKRIEFTRQLWLRQQALPLFVSSGRLDDYLELQLPVDITPESGFLSGLASIPRDTEERCFDICVRAGPPATVCILVLYPSSACPANEDPVTAEWSAARLVRIFVALHSALPEVSFADLIPAEALGVPAVTGAACDAVHKVVSAPSEEIAAHRPTEFRKAARASSQPPSQTGPELAKLPPITHKFGIMRKSRLVAVAAMRRAHMYAGRGRVDRALEAVGEVLRHDRRNEDACLLRAELLLLQQREQKRQRQPSSAQAHLEAGFSYLLFNANRKALDALRRAVVLDPGLYLAHTLMGIAQHREGDASGAFSSYQQALRIRPAEEVPAHLISSLAKGEAPPLLAEDRLATRLGWPGLPLSRGGLPT